MKFFKSSWPTLIVNGLMLAAGVGTYLMGDPVMLQNPDAVAMVAAVVGALNTVLHFLGKDAKPPAPAGK